MTPNTTRMEPATVITAKASLGDSNKVVQLMINSPQLLCLQLIATAEQHSDLYQFPQKLCGEKRTLLFLDRIRLAEAAVVAIINSLLYD